MTAEYEPGKVVNHWGKWVDSNTPVTGVISSNNLNWEWVNEICLSCEQYFKEINEDVTLDDEEKESLLDMSECDSGHEKIFGDWKFDTVSGKYDIDYDGEFAAIIRESEIQVVFSKTIAKNKKLCSPCFHGQVDLDSENGEFQGYTLPDYLIYKRDEE